VSKIARVNDSHDPPRLRLTSTEVMDAQADARKREWLGDNAKTCKRGHVFDSDGSFAARRRRCPDCKRASDRRYEQKRYYQRLAEGRCPRCGGPLILEAGAYAGEPGTSTRCIYCVSEQAMYDLCRIR
jgi:hypothetical protein